jgi:mRNA interferase RelE/StbE
VWKIEYSRSSLRALRRLPRSTAETIVKKIAALAVDPYAPNNNATRLQGRPGYRLRVGDWRVLYELSENRLLVLDVRPRGGAYQ